MAPFDGVDAAGLVRRAAAGEPQRFEWLGTHSSGTDVWVEVSLNRATIRGAERVIASVRDITQRKLAEDALHHAYEELERRVEDRTVALAQARDEAEQARAAAECANRAKSEFLSRMSHELRTPLNSILGFAQVLEGGELPGHQLRSVQHILRGGRHLLRLINEVLEIARIESGRHNLSLEPVRVSAVVGEAMGMVRPLASQWDVALDEPVGADGDIYVHADRQRMVQVLLNLLANAIKYNVRGGRVHIECTPHAAADRVTLVVRDTGPGIPPDRLPHLFTPFARLGAEQSQVEGTGLGLALSQRLIEAMSGSLRLEATGPGGSAFALELLAVRSPLLQFDETVAPSSPGDHVHGPATLPYIEDNLANLSLVETILQARPRWRTVPALQGQMGIELAREHEPDIVLLDLHLPDMSGEDVLRRLRADARTAGVPVVVISADATHGTVERLLEAGAAAFLTKPLDIHDFLSTIDRLLIGIAIEP